MSSVSDDALANYRSSLAIPVDTPVSMADARYFYAGTNVTALLASYSDRYAAAGNPVDAAGLTPINKNVPFLAIKP